jgi:hypothetical protein
MSFFPWPTIGHKSRAGAVDNYPMDLDASLRFVRPKTGIDYFPTPNNFNNFAKLGQVSGFMPQLDGRVWGQMWGRDPFGPIVSQLPVNLQYQVNVPGLNKQQPQY